jgi:hypothetical protein
MGGQARDELDGVLGGAVAFAAATVQAHGQLAARAALPEHLDRGLGLGTADGHHDLAHQRAQQLLAIAVAGRGRVQELAQVARQPRERQALVVVERFRAGVLECGQCRALALGGGERLLERAFEAPGDEAVLGLAGVEPAPRAVGLELRLLQRQAPPTRPRPPITPSLPDHQHQSVDPRLACAMSAPP